MTTPSLDISGAIARITLQRPEAANKLAPEDITALRAHLREINAADGVRVARRLLAAGEISGPVVVLETALPVKFAETITQATGIVPPRPERFSEIEDLPRHVTRIPVDADAVRRVIGGVA